MLIEHLQLLEIHVAFLELDALFGFFLHQSLSLAPNLDLSITLVLNLVELTSHARLLLFNAPLNVSDFFLLLLFLALEDFSFLPVICLESDAYLPLLFLVLVEGLPPRSQFLQQLALTLLL